MFRNKPYYLQDWSYPFVSFFADRDAPAADFHDPEVIGDRVRAGGHRRAGHGRPEGRHARQGKEEGGAEARPPPADLQRGEILRGMTRARLWEAHEHWVAITSCSCSTVVVAVC